MQFRELEKMYRVEENHWWFAGKRALFKRLLRSRLAGADLKILDIGSGTGAVPRDFGRFGWICATDRSVEALRFARSRGVAAVACCDALSVPIASNSVDLVLAFDILEHVEDDAGALDELTRVLKPGGAAAIHVPAWPRLWSAHDEALEHKRRYTRKSFSVLLAKSNLEIEHLGWSGATILAPAFALRGLRRLLPDKPNETSEADLFSLPKPLNAFMRAVYDVEAAAAAGIGLPFGLSLAAIATKRAEPISSGR
jgi:SAM-dependent methyltransferase